MSYRFIVCELKTGDVIDEAPLRISQKLSRVLRGDGGGEFQLPIRHEETPENWEQLILPWRSLILAVDEETERIVGHGIPNDRIRRGGGIIIYPAVSIEGYLMRRRVPDREYRQRDQAAIAKDLAAVAGDAAGIPLQYDCPDTGVRRDREYSGADNAWVFERLQELAAVQDGFDWTIDVDWADDAHTRVNYTFRTGYPHLGNRTDEPEHLFDKYGDPLNGGGNVLGYTHSDQWGRGNAATYVDAQGDGNNDTRVTSSPVIDTVREAAGWPRLEHRETFSGVTEPATIDNHARGIAARLFGGQSVISITVRNGAGTSLGDLTLGDTARVSISDDDLELDELLVVVGWSIPPGGETFTPVLARLGEA